MPSNERGRSRGVNGKEPVRSSLHQEMPLERQRSHVSGARNQAAILFLHDLDVPYGREFFALLMSQLKIDLVLTNESRRCWIRVTDPSFTSREKVSPLAIFVGILSGKYAAVVHGGWDTAAEFSSMILATTLTGTRQLRLYAWTGSWNREAKTITLRRLLADPVLRMTLRKADGVTCYGAQSQAMMLSMGVSTNRIRIAFNSVSAPPPIDETQGITPRSTGPRIVVSVGRLVPYKGVDLAIRAVALLGDRNIHVGLDVIGVGPVLNRLERLTRKRGLDGVRFHGDVNRRTKFKQIRRAVALVLPSTYRNGTCEAWGLTPNEALSVGRPVITTHAVGAVDDLVRDGKTGLIVPPGDTLALAKALENSALDSSKAERLGQTERSLAEMSFTMNQMIAIFTEFLRQLVEAGIGLLGSVGKAGSEP